MRKCNEKGREIRFYSEKNQAFVTVRSKEERSYSKYLEDRKDVTAYEAGKKWSIEHLQQIPRVEIRKEYLSTLWQSDFYITFADGRTAVREVILPEMLTKLADVEKLELSRRYWQSLGIRDWKLVIMEG